MEIVIIVAVLFLVGALVGGAFVATRRRKDGIVEPPTVTKDRAPATKTGPATKAPSKPDPALLDEAPTETLVPPEVEREPVVVEPSAEPEAPEVVEPVPGAEPEGVPDEVLEVELPVKPRFRDRLGKARGLLSGYVGSITGRSKIDEEAWEELEEALIRADVGITTTTKLLDTLRGRVKDESITDGEALLDALKAELISLLAGFDRDLHYAETAPSVWLFVGVNGVGKTTTIGKLARRETEAGTRVLLAAGDTFRAAAAEQLSMWADRSGAEIVRGAEGGDPSAVIFDAVESASSRGADLVLADTAGRLHNKINLMEELRKVRRVADKGAGTVSEVLLVIDATTGQNGLTQARQFKEAADLTGVVLTKLDGSAKGGIVVAVQAELDIPVKLVGLGEGVEDLVAFDPEEFVEALFS